ncbi:MAG: hypothetical protein LAO23_19605 [Acidobacteriia bacterium]|nr:hypothetical protein [Terriglobia bacterium]
MSPKTQAPPVPALPPAPPNPPMFGADAVKKKAGGQAPQQFNASVLGSVPTQPGGQKSLLGQ